MKTKHLSILGSTGSIGKNTLEIVSQFPKLFQVEALAARSYSKTLLNQIIQFRPMLVAVFDEEEARIVKQEIPSHIKTRIVHGKEGYKEVATFEKTDTVVNAVVGNAGLLPTLSAIDAGKNIALANKETLVMAGDLVMARVAEKKVSFIPIDSEHSAIFQCLAGNPQKEVQKILLTASGGPFWKRKPSTFKNITLEEALIHPNWQMGKKITIDSATLMNKGLEVIEAKHLFQLDVDQIEILIHPESVIHSMVAYQDGSILAQLSRPDMRGAISYALSYPHRLPLELPLPDFFATSFHFYPPDMKTFPCLQLALDAIHIGGTMPCVLSAANEVAVEAFLNKQLNFIDISTVIKKTMNLHQQYFASTLEEILSADEWSRNTAKKIITSTLYG